MDVSEKNDIPMLSDMHLKSDSLDDSTIKRLSSKRGSFSVCITTNPLGSCKNDAQSSSVQMSGPIHAGSKNEFIFQPPHGALKQKTSDPELENYPSMDVMNDDNWSVENYVGKNEHLMKSGQLGMCSDPYCTTCPMYDNVTGHQKHFRTPELVDAKFHNMVYGNAKGWAKRKCSFLRPYIPGVMNPHTKIVQQWNKFFVISCLFAVFIDPLFFFLLSVQQDNKCITLNWPMTTTIVALRSVTDFIYLMHILLQFRLAYVAPESRVVGSGDLVDDPKRIALNYFFGYFIVDLFVVLPLPQIIILAVLPDSIAATGANEAKNLLRASILVQYVPRLYRFLPLLAGQSSSGLIFESAWANFIINLLTFMLASHVVGSCWYLFGLQAPLVVSPYLNRKSFQHKWCTSSIVFAVSFLSPVVLNRRVNQCLRDACHDSNITKCMEFIDCGHGNDYGEFENDPIWGQWTSNDNATACFGQGGFAFGIYQNAVELTTNQNIMTRYLYSLFWGFQQISTLAGNQVPSYFVWEVLFTMAIIGVGLLLFALLIGNMQNFLQSLGRRRLEMSLRRRDVEQWMSHRRLPEDLRRQVREAERFNWAATRGVNEEMLMEGLPEDLQREIRRHLFKFVKKVRIFQVLDEPIIDAICERLKTKTYIKGSKILSRGGLVDKMVFIIRGKMESVGEDMIGIPLSDSDVCGEELLTWCLEHSSVNKDGKRIRLPGYRLPSNRLARCLTNVEAFVLRAVDLEEVTSLFARFLRSPRVQGAIRYESPYWRGLAAKQIQVAWRYRKKRLRRADSHGSQNNYHWI